VPAEVIPAAGRDVQCSNCGNTWFQEPASASTLVEDDETFATREAQIDVSGAPDPQPEDDFSEMLEDELAAAAAMEDVAPEDDGDYEETYEDGGEEHDLDRDADFSKYDPEVPAEDNLSQAVSSAKGGRSTLTDEVASVLRDEVAFEEEARKADLEALETQPDLGALETDGADDDLRATIKSLDQVGDRDIAIAGGRSARRNLLPDVEEINSSLRTNQAKKIEDLTPEGFDYINEDYEIEHRRGFRWGFVGTLSGLAAAIALYFYAEPLKARAPQFADPIDGYVALVDRGRGAMDDALLDFGIYVQTLMAQATQAVTDRQAE